MGKLTFSAILFGALAAGAGQAAAADLPVKAPPPVVVASGWTGLYIGGEIGAQWADPNMTTTCLGLIGTFCTPDGTRIPSRIVAGNPVANPFFVDASSPHKFDILAARLGAYAGYNYQFAPNWLIGIEGDLAFAWQPDNRKSVAGIVGCAINCLGIAGPGIDSTSVQMLWDTAIRARLGYLATPDVLLYVAGGFAMQAVSLTLRCGPLAANPWCVANRSGTDGSILPGWTVGAGVEYKYNRNWILRGEYRYSEFDRFNSRIFQATGDDVFSNTKWRTHIATFGVSYLFNMGAAPGVVAKY
jgi:outer membrane immunogenic protein